MKDLDYILKTEITSTTNNSEHIHTTVVSNGTIEDVIEYIPFSSTIVGQPYFEEVVRNLDFEYGGPLFFIERGFKPNICDGINFMTVSNMSQDKLIEISRNLENVTVLLEVK